MGEDESMSSMYLRPPPPRFSCFEVGPLWSWSRCPVFKDNVAEAVPKSMNIKTQSTGDDERERKREEKTRIIQPSLSLANRWFFSSSSPLSPLRSVADKSFAKVPGRFWRPKNPLQSATPRILASAFLTNVFFWINFPSGEDIASYRKTFILEAGGDASGLWDWAISSVKKTFSKNRVQLLYGSLV